MSKLSKIPPFKDIKHIYGSLLLHYGKQGWWPLLDLKNANKNPTSSGLLKNYHPGDYSLPTTNKQRLEIIIGAYLVQHTSWRNTEQALLSLERQNLLNVKRLDEIHVTKLAELIRPSRYYNQKAHYLKHLATFLSKHTMEELMNFETKLLRELLLKLKGIGEETADSILCYVFKRPVFVIDLYTRNFLSRMGIIKFKEKNKIIKDKVQSNIPSNHEILNEFHALIVEHAKQRCKTKKPLCSGCIFEKSCLIIVED
ncbi:MAG: endonuclease III domain-containing protein [Candidatus Hodarchaeales archaeon]|jgi:endonuclease-3 related protein